MSVSPGYRDFVLEQLGRILPVASRSMFGGVGIYSEEAFFALIAGDRLYFKVDDSNRPDFEREDMQPFKPYEHRPVVMSYYEVPVDVLEDTEELRTWVEKALAVARKPRRRGRQK